VQAEKYPVISDDARALEREKPLFAHVFDKAPAKGVSGLNGTKKIRRAGGGFVHRSG
jgi:hypothetical protein